MADQGPRNEPHDFGDIVQIRDDGILWMMNRVIFHPRGFALGITEDETDLYLYGDGEEVWKFALPDEMEQELFDKFEAMLAKRRRIAAEMKETRASSD